MTFTTDEDMLRIVAALLKRSDLPPLFCNRGTLSMAWPPPRYEHRRFLTQAQAEKLAAGLSVEAALQPRPLRRSVPLQPKPPKAVTLPLWSLKRAANGD